MRFLFLLLCLAVSNHLFSAATVLVEVEHQENVKVKLKDAALGGYLTYQPIFDFPEKTTFGLDDGSFTLLEIIVDDEPYLLYVQGSYININLKSAKIKSDAYFLFKRKKDFFETNVNGKWLLHLFEIEKYYKNHLTSIDSLIQVDNAYGYQENGVKYWDKRSAKKLLNYIDKHYDNEQDFKLKYNSPSFIKFSEILYSLAFQYSEKDISRTLSIEEQYDLIENTMPKGLGQSVTLYHFFRPSAPLVVMESASTVDQFKRLDSRIKFAAQKSIELKKANILPSTASEINWVVGFDVDESLNAFFAKRDYKKPALIIFWTTFGGAMDYEYHHLKQLQSTFGDYFDFVYVCVNAFEQEQKAKAIIKREGLNGNHLFPKSADAFWKSEWKDKKISTLPFYVLTDANEEVVLAVETPLDFNKRISAQMNKIKKSKNSALNN